MGQVFTESTLDTFPKDEEIFQKEYEYIDYLKGHIAGVKKAYKVYFLPLLKRDDLVLKTISVDEFKDGIREAEPDIETHDNSKWETPEFEKYRVHWYYTTTEKELMDSNPDYMHRCEQEYEEAWKHHREVNAHHPGEYWQDPETGEYKDMSISAIVQMICDWASFGDDIITWYETKADEEKSMMSIRTREILEELLYNVLFK